MPTITLAPDADDSVGSWTNETAGTTLYTSVDEASSDDTDFIKSPNNPSTSICRLRLSDPSGAMGDTMTVAVRCKASAGTVNLAIRLKEGSTVRAQWTDTGLSTAWTTVTHNLTSGERASITDFTNLYVELEANPATTLLDIYPSAAFAYSLRKLRNAYAGSALRLRAGGSNVETDIGFTANGDFDITAAAYQLTVATNYAIRSQEMENASWGFSVVAATANVGTAPDGTSTADRVNASATSSPQGIFMTGSPSSTTVTGSAYLKQANYRYGSIRVGNSGTAANWGAAMFDLQTGTITDQSNGSGGSGRAVSITDAGNGWYRCAVTITATGANFVGINVYNAATTTWASFGDTASWTGVANQGIWAWGAQLENGTTMTAYIPTTSATVSRDGNGYIKTWYDQSGNGLDLTQTTTASQFQYLASGPGGWPTLKGSQQGGVQTNMLRASTDLSAYMSTQFTIMSVINPNDAATTDNLNTVISWGDASASTNHIFVATRAHSSDTHHYVDFGGNSGTARLSFSDTSGTWFSANHIFEAYRDSGDTQAIVKDNSVLVSATRTDDLTTSSSQLVIGSYYAPPSTYASFYDGQISEVVGWGTDLGTNRSGARANLNTYYSVY